MDKARGAPPAHEADMDEPASGRGTVRFPMRIAAMPKTLNRMHR